jgi:hypothetical protein
MADFGSDWPSGWADSYANSRRRSMSAEHAYIDRRIASIVEIKAEAFAPVPLAPSSS